MTCRDVGSPEEIRARNVRNNTDRRRQHTLNLARRAVRTAAYHRWLGDRPEAAYWLNIAASFRRLA